MYARMERTRFHIMMFAIQDNRSARVSVAAVLPGVYCHTVPDTNSTRGVQRSLPVSVSVNILLLQQ
jgi:hypothetical protein